MSSDCAWVAVRDCKWGSRKWAGFLGQGCLKGGLKTSSRKGANKQKPKEVKTQLQTDKRSISGWGVNQGQRPLKRCSSKDFQQVIIVPTATAAFHDETCAVGMLLQE
jgi:hypothetical protein